MMMTQTFSYLKLLPSILLDLCSCIDSCHPSSRLGSEAKWVQTGGRPKELQLDMCFKMVNEMKWFFLFHLFLTFTTNRTRNSETHGSYREQNGRLQLFLKHPLLFPYNSYNIFLLTPCFCIYSRIQFYIQFLSCEIMPPWKIQSPFCCSPQGICSPHVQSGWRSARDWEPPDTRGLRPGERTTSSGPSVTKETVIHQPDVTPCIITTSVAKLSGVISMSDLPDGSVKTTVLIAPI